MIGLKGRQYWEFGSRLLVSVSVLGSAIALGTISVSAVKTMVDRKELTEADRLTRVRLDSTMAGTTIERQIEEHETLLSALKDPVSVQEEQKSLAGLYSQLGRKSEVGQQFAESEAAYQRALNLDPNNAVYMAALANLYNDRAQTQPNPGMKLTLYQTSRQFYRQASTRAVRQEAAQDYSNNAAIATLGLARQLRATGRWQEAEQNLREATDWAMPDVRRQINAMLHAE